MRNLEKTEWQELKTSQAPSGKPPEHSLDHLPSYTGSSMLPITYALPSWFWETEAWILTLPLGESWVLYETQEFLLNPDFYCFSPYFPAPSSFLLQDRSIGRSGHLAAFQQWSQSTSSTLGSHFLTPSLPLAAGSLRVSEPWQGEWQFPHPAKPLPFISASTHTSPSSG